MSTLDRPVTPNPYDLLPADRVVHRDQRRRHGRTAAQGRPGRRRGQHLARSCPGPVPPRAPRASSVTCFDPDAPTPSGFWHWVLVDLPADVTSLDTGAGARATCPARPSTCRNDGGEAGFMGAAPPEGDQVHRYFFVVHAVGEESLGVDAAASPAVVSFNLAFKTLGRAIVTAPTSTDEEIS